MARNAVLWLSCLFLLGATGCTWTETYNEYPPSAYAATTAAPPPSSPGQPRGGMTTSG